MLGSVLLVATFVFVVATVYTVVNFICAGAARGGRKLQGEHVERTPGGLFAADETRAVSGFRRQEESFREEREEREEKENV